MQTTIPLDERWHEFSAIEVEAPVEKYHGLPTALGRSVDDQFEHIVGHVKYLVNGLVARNLTGAEVLVKATTHSWRRRQARTRPNRSLLLSRR
jgi:hypothetical protein